MPVLKVATSRWKYFEVSVNVAVSNWVATNPINARAWAGLCRVPIFRNSSLDKENARQTIKHWREEAWKDIQDGFKTGEISEDNKYKGKDKLQELVDEYNKKVEEKAEKKTKEIEV